MPRSSALARSRVDLIKQPDGFSKHCEDLGKGACLDPQLLKSIGPHAGSPPPHAQETLKPAEQLLVVG
eukprot:scaffold80848_cov30-Tisochrysis_lutea.AAC.3